MFAWFLATALLASCLAPASASASGSGVNGPDAGNWTVGECIMAQFAMEFTVHYNNSDTNQTMVNLFVFILLSMVFVLVVMGSVSVHSIVLWKI